MVKTINFVLCITLPQHMHTHTHVHAHTHTHWIHSCRGGAQVGTWQESEKHRFTLRCPRSRVAAASLMFPPLHVELSWHLGGVQGLSSEWAAFDRVSPSTGVTGRLWGPLLHCCLSTNPSALSCVMWGLCKHAWSSLWGSASWRGGAQEGSWGQCGPSP